MDVSNDLQVGASVTALDIDRVAAARFGLSAEDVSQTLYDAFGQRQVGEYQTEVNQYKVVLELDARQRGRAESLDWFYLRSPLSGEMVPLSAIAKVAAPRSGPLQINHNGMFPAVNLSFNLAAGVSSARRCRRCSAPRRRSACPRPLSACSRARRRPSRARWPRNRC